jgi:hypothetical protein
MSEAHECFLGVYVDHLYQNCPNLTRARTFGQPRCGCTYHDDDVAKVGDKALGMVDPEGTDICGRCVRRWRRKVADD